MVRGLLEKVLSLQILYELFECSAKNQYTRELFSTIVNLISLLSTDEYRTLAILALEFFSIKN